MPAASPLIEHVIDLLSDWGEVTARPRAEGWALYHRRQLFALVVEDTLCLKVDDLNRGRFEEAGGHPCMTSGRSDGPGMLSFWSPPESAFDDAEELAAWTQSAVEAARRARSLLELSDAPPRRRRGSSPG